MYSAAIQALQRTNSKTSEAQGNSHDLAPLKAGDRPCSFFATASPIVATMASKNGRESFGGKRAGVTARRADRSPGRMRAPPFRQDAIYLVAFRPIHIWQLRDRNPFCIRKPIQSRIQHGINKVCHDRFVGLSVKRGVRNSFNSREPFEVVVIIVIVVHRPVMQCVDTCIDPKL